MLEGKKIKQMSKYKYTIEDVKILFEKYNYVLLDKKYKGANYKYNFKCPNGHKDSISFSKFKYGKRCYQCKVGKRYNISDLRMMFFNEGYILLSRSYKSIHTKYRYICSKGHTGYITIADWVHSKKRCASCAKRGPQDIDELRKEFSEIGYTLLDFDYINNHTGLCVMCDNGHITNTLTLHNFRQGARCYRCSLMGQQSKKEIELLEYIQKYASDTEASNRSLAYPFEIDIFNKRLGIAIEYCGLYWHSEIGGHKDKKYHLNKLSKCNEKNIQLLTIFEDEYRDFKDSVLSKVGICFGRVDYKKYYARKCRVHKINRVTAKEFCDKYHLQKYVDSSYRYGIFYEDILLSVMTFSKISRAKSRCGTKNAYELVRFCSIPYVCVIGGASKMLSVFEKDAKPAVLFSFADRRWSMGNLYYNLGFELDHISSQSYWYTDGYKRLHRFSMRKEKCGNTVLTEKEYWISNGYDVIWDCGAFVFIKNY